MTSRFRRRLIFAFERLLLRGAHYRLLFITLVIAGISVVGGFAILGLTPADGDPADTIWWAFLRLTDPGYLGDDHGVWRRLVSTVLTLLGYVFFMGALVAIMTEWLNATIQRLERGETPLALRGHFLLLRMTDRTPIVIGQFLAAEERVERFLVRQGADSTVRVVALVEELNPLVVASLRDHLGSLWDDRSVILRSGSCLDRAHLERVDFANAAAILLPASRLGNSRGEDAETVKTVLSIARHPLVAQAEEVPRIIAEVSSAKLIDIVRTSYPGVLELVPTKTIVARMIVHTLRHQGLSLVLGELLARNVGSAFYFEEVSELVGVPFGEVSRRFGLAVVLGLARRGDDGWEVRLNPPANVRLAAGDRLVLMARSKADSRAYGPAPERQAEAPEPKPTPPIGATWPDVRRILILGWNAKLVNILEELCSYSGERFEVTIGSVVPLEERAAALERAGLSESRVPVAQVVVDYTELRDVSPLSLGSYHNVVLLGRDWVADDETSDAQTTLVYYVVLAALEGAPARPSLLVELMDAESAWLFDDRPGEVVLSPLMMGDILAHMALHPALGAVLEDLFTVGGPEIHFRPLSELGLSPGPCTFSAVRQAALLHGDLALGVRLHDDEFARARDVLLNPVSDEPLTLTASASVLVLTTYPG